MRELIISIPFKMRNSEIRWAQKSKQSFLSHCKFNWRVINAQHTECLMSLTVWICWRSWWWCTKCTRVVTWCTCKLQWRPWVSRPKHIREMFMALVDTSNQVWGHFFRVLMWKDDLLRETEPIFLFTISIVPLTLVRRTIQSQTLELGPVFSWDLKSRSFA